MIKLKHMIHIDFNNEKGIDKFNIYAILIVKDKELLKWKRKKVMDY